MNTKLVAVIGIMLTSAVLFGACTWGKSTPASTETGADMGAPTGTTQQAQPADAGSQLEMIYETGSAAQSPSSNQPDNTVKYEGTTKPYDKSMGVY